MKKVLLALILVSAMSASAQKLTKDCWSAGAYHMTATQGGANGKIEVTIYNNNNRDVVLQPTRTFLLDNQGSVSFSIDQPVRTDYRYAYARWFTKNEDGSPALVKIMYDDDKIELAGGEEFVTGFVYAGKNN